MTNKKNNKKGFTLIEILITLGVIVILATIFIISISPGVQMEKSRNQQRRAHILVVYLALTEYKSKEGDGSFPLCVGTSESDVYSCESDLVSDYIVALPEDPSSSCAYNTGYFVKKDTLTGVLGVKAMCAEDGAEITVGEW